MAKLVSLLKFCFAASTIYAVVLQAAHAAGACPGQDVAAHQGATAFNVLTDGQPGTPRLPQLSLVPFYNFEDETFVNLLSLSGVVATSGFWCQAQFEVFAPVLKAADGEIDLEKSVTASWQQRWLIDDGSLPTFSTVVAVQTPYDDPDADTEILLIGIIAKSTSWGALYLNALALSKDGSDFATVDYAGIVGVKRFLDPTLALFADVSVDEGGVYALELSAQRDYSNGLSLGPGIRLARAGAGSDNIETVIGIYIFKVFGG